MLETEKKSAGRRADLPPPAEDADLLASTGPMLGGHMRVSEYKHREGLLRVPSCAEHRLVVTLESAGELRLVGGSEERVIPAQGQQTTVIPGRATLWLHQHGYARFCVVHLGAALLQQEWARRGRRAAARRALDVDARVATGDAVMAHLVLALHESLLRGRTASPPVLGSVTQALCGHLIDHYCEAKSVPALTADELQQLAAELRRGPGEAPCTAHRAAVALGMNEGRFLRALRQSTGETFAQHLRRVRLEQAYELLRRGEASVTEVGLECGFADLAYFSRAFARQFGVAPSVVRRGAPAIVRGC